MPTGPHPGSAAPGQRALRILARREVSAARLALDLAAQGLDPKQVAAELEVVQLL